MLPAQKAYSLVQFKSIDDDQRIIEGIASTPELDRGGDIMDPFGAKFTLPMSLFWFHQKDKPIGDVFAATPRADGIHIKARIAKGVLPYIDEAWALIKARLVRGLSIDWRPLSLPKAHNGGRKYSDWEWLGLSAVTLPMNSNATISLIKSVTDADRALSGSAVAVVRPSAGVPASPKATAMNYSEQIEAAQKSLDEKSAEMDVLMQREAEEGLEETDQQTLEALTKGVDEITKKINRLRIQEAAMATKAKAIGASPSPVKPMQSRIEVTDHAKELPKGTIFVRYARAVAAGKGSYSDTLEFAKQFANTPQVAHMVKEFHGRGKAVEGTSVVASPGWGGELVNPNTAMTEFVEELMPQTILGKVSTFDQVPFNIPIITQTGGSTFDWVDEGNEKPVGELAFERDTMPYSKCAGIIVMTEELIRLSTPKAEARARTDMINQCRKFLDEQFIQVGITAGNTSPASITNGVASPAASGSGVEELKYDLMVAMQTFTAAKIPLTGLVIVTTPELALGISLMTNQLGQTPNGFNVTPEGGRLLGYQVIVSESVDPGHVIIFKPSEIFLADDGQVRLDSSNQATLNMAAPGGAGAATFSLWQRNCVGLRAERWINWKKKRPNVVAVIDTAAYGPTVGSP